MFFKCFSLNYLKLNTKSVKICLRGMSNKTSFRSLRVFELSPDFDRSVKIVDQPLVDPSSDQILVKNIYVGINATDLNVTAGRYFAHDPLPYPLGIESLGQIVKIGDQIKKYSVGEYVVVKCAKMRAYSQYLYATLNDGLTAIPEPKAEYLCLLGTSGLTASIGLMEGAKLAKGETVLVTAAAGGVGHMAVQWAKLQGCHVVAMTSTNKKKEFLKQLGVDRVINYKDEDLDQVLKQEYPKGIDVIWETIGSPLFEQLFEHLARKGRLINIGATSGYKTVGYAPININDFIVKLHYGARTVVGFLTFDYKHKYEEYSQQLLKYYNNNQIKVRVDFGEDIGEGIEAIFKGVKYLHSGSNMGKVLVKI